MAEARIKTIPHEEHMEHHEFLRDVIPMVREYLDERKAARERWEKYRTSFFGAIFAALGAAFISVFAWIGRLFIEWLRNTPSG